MLTSVNSKMFNYLTSIRVRPSKGGVEIQSLISLVQKTIKKTVRLEAAPAVHSRRAGV